MKLIKKLFVIVLLAGTGVVSAQQFGIEAGYVNSTTTNSDAVTGFQFGPVGEVQLAGPLNIEYGIKYQLLMKNTDGMLGTSNYSGHFVEVPLRLKLVFPLGNDLKMFAFGGPNLDFGLEEMTKTVVNIGSSEVTTTTHHYEIDTDDNDKPDYSRFNLQLGVGGGIRYHNLQIKVGYDWGMNDINTRDDLTMKRNQLNLGIGFTL
ncbi:MAG: outer membrane beta-barrel protein [Paludibacter sp.]|jgi:hypothetical protein|nr:outer membrane beta-barrel protein [Paludibacter sp.]